MPMQQVEYEFPDPDKEENLQEVEIEAKEEKAPDIEVEGAVGRETIEKPSDKKKKDVIQAGEVEIEVEDDTPPEDRGKRPAPPQDLKDGELSEYGEKVRERLKTLSKTYHDERRAKEAVQREREALEQYAKKLVEENQQLKTRSTENHNALIESAKKQVESELAMAQQRYRQAYESGQTDAIIEAQQALNTAQIRADKVSGLKPKRVAPAEADTALQPEQNNVQSQKLTAPPQPQVDQKAEAWRDENPWFGSDDEMTAFALGLHTKLTKEGVDPQSDEYYEKINSRVRQVFPDQFDEGIDVEPEEAPKSKPSNVVAPVTRSTSPKKIKLSQSQIAIARRLGVPLEIYAKQVDDLARKQNA